MEEKLTEVAEQCYFFRRILSVSTVFGVDICYLKTVNPFLVIYGKIGKKKRSEERRVGKECS